jgi:short-subunit dehydrogenase
MTTFSIAGHYDVSAPGFHMYSASKHAVTALTEGLRKELVNRHSNIRVTVSTVPLHILPSEKKNCNLRIRKYTKLSTKFYLS